MIRSMTGFGSAQIERDGGHYGAEVRSVNNKFFKGLVRLPEELQGLEAELESIVRGRFSRGSVTITVTFADLSAEAAATLNIAAMRRYIDQLQELNNGDRGEVQIDLSGLLALPGVLVADTDSRRLDEAKAIVHPLVEEACDRLLEMRDREGRTLHEDLGQHCAKIDADLGVVRERVPGVVEMYQDRLRQRMESLLAEVGAAVREEDLLREVAVFAERSDISEEVSRLQGHLMQFMEIIDGDSSKPAGRTLDFLAQEMLREANTIGSKCLDVEVSRRIVEIKGSIDRLKEQAQNVE